MMVQEVKTVLMVGVAGSGMRGLAYLLAADGKRVLGVDSSWEEVLEAQSLPEFESVELLDCDISAVDWASIDLVIHSDAVPADSPWLLEAVDKEVTVLSYQVALGQFARSRRTIAVAGTHGKSSTTAFLAQVMLKADLDPTVLLGARAGFLKGGHAHYGASDWLLVEADEYRAHFLELTPEILIITSIDFDHADYFKDLAAVTDVFARLLRQMPEPGLVVVPEAVHEQFDLPWPRQTQVVTKQEAQVSPEPLPGAHMRMNAALVLRVASFLGISETKGRLLLDDFPGLGRRFEEIGEWQGMVVISDYGHHPAEIEATVAAARQKWPDKTIGVLLEAHTDERLRVFHKEFVASLRGVESVWLYPVFVPAGREDDYDSIERIKLLEDLQKAGVPTELVKAPIGLGQMLDQAAGAVDVLLAFSAGRLDGALRSGLSKRVDRLAK